MKKAAQHAHLVQQLIFCYYQKIWQQNKQIGTTSRVLLNFPFMIMTLPVTFLHYAKFYCLKISSVRLYNLYIYTKNFLSTSKTLCPLATIEVTEVFPYHLSFAMLAHM